MDARVKLMIIDGKKAKYHYISYINSGATYAFTYFLGYGQQTSAANGQLPVAVIPQTPSNLQGGSKVTDPIVLAIAFVGAAAGVIYRTVYPYSNDFKRLKQKEKSQSNF
jgi:hypothetical protein